MIASDTLRALIAAHAEPEVVEVYGDEARRLADARGRMLAGVPVRRIPNARAILDAAQPARVSMISASLIHALGYAFAAYYVALVLTRRRLLK